MSDCYCRRCGANLNMIYGKTFKSMKKCICGAPLYFCKQCKSYLNTQSGFSFDTDYHYCIECGSRNQIESNTNTETSVNRDNSKESKFDSKTNVRFCTWCGNRLQENEIFCKSCGHKCVVNQTYPQQTEKQSHSESSITDDITHGRIEKKEAFAYCSKCGNEIESDDEFCSKCGNAVRKKYNSSFEDDTTRKETYDGEIRKCPNCGEVLKSFAPNCPSCGYELRNSKTANCVYKFSRKLDSVSSTKRKDDLIRHFVIPNTKEDIIEFILLAAANLEAGGNNSDAWMIKLEYAYKKAVFVFGNDPEIERIKRIYYGAVNDYKEIQRAKKQKLNSDYFSSHWIGIFAAIIVAISIILIFLGSVFGVGPTWDWTSTETSGHLWWKTETYTNHHWPILTIIGIILGGIFLIIGIIFGSIQSSRYKRRK